MAQQEEGPRAPFIGDFLVNRWNDASRELDPAYVQAFVEYVDGGSQGEPPKPLYKLSAAWVKLLDTTITLWMSDYDQILQCLDFLNPAKQGQITTRASAYHLSFWHQLMYSLCEKTCQLAVQSVRVYLKTADSSYKKQVEAQLKKDIKKIEVEFGKVRPQLVWGRMAIVDTKPFKLRVILHRIFGERPQVTGIPAWPGGAACYRRSRYIL